MSSSIPCGRRLVLKPEYVASTNKAPSEPSAAETLPPEPPSPPPLAPDAHAPDDASARPEQPKPKRQKGRANGRNNYQPSMPRICKALLQNKCNFGDSCKFSHDIDAFLAAKQADLDGPCPIFTLHGRCRYGITCRFASAHPAEPLSEAELVVELNKMPFGLLQRLRKRTYDFSLSAAIEKQVNALASAEAKAGSSGAADVDAADSKASVLEDPGADDGDLVGKEKVKRKLDVRGKIYLAPLTTVGNLPFRRVCKGLGVDITCSEMALATNLLQGSQTEWALMRRHTSEDVFGVQLAGAHANTMSMAAQLIEETLQVDFIDINMGCPIDLICNMGAGASLAARTGRVQRVVRTMSGVLQNTPLTVKCRTGYEMHARTAHKLIPMLRGWGAAAVTLHGRSRQQRYAKLADWKYIDECAAAANAVGMPLIGNGDVYGYDDVDAALHSDSLVSGVMLARGALIKPWLATEIRERRHWDISASERLDLLKDFVRYGLEHWGADDMGVSRTRNFLLEWLSFLHRYVPVGVLETVPAKMTDIRPPFVGRSELETLFASSSPADWVKISEMLLGPVPADFTFVPKHKANAHSPALQTWEG